MVGSSILVGGRSAPRRLLALGVALWTAVALPLLTLPPEVFAAGECTMECSLEGRDCCCKQAARQGGVGHASHGHASEAYPGGPGAGGSGVVPMHAGHEPSAHHAGHGDGAAQAGHGAHTGHIEPAGHEAQHASHGATPAAALDGATIGSPWERPCPEFNATLDKSRAEDDLRAPESRRLAGDRGDGGQLALRPAPGHRSALAELATLPRPPPVTSSFS
ncbi:MAG: hypothetical protein AAF657_23225 [Acidobacteriota bacterium]